MEDKLDNSPIVFGVILEDIKRFGDGFSYEVYQCRREPSDGIGDGDNLNIMHVSTDLTAIHDTITEIVDFLESRHFCVERIDVSKEWSEADVLIIGGNRQRRDDVVKLLHVFSSICGMFDRFDILSYTLDGKTATGWSPMEKLCLFGDSFKFECMFTIHYNIRKWIDPVINRGIIADRVVDIEWYLYLVVEWNEEPQFITLSNTLNRFKINIDDKGRNDLNSEIFFAAMRVVRLIRNMHLHGFGVDADIYSVIMTFNKIVLNHNKKHLWICPQCDDFRSKMDIMKACVGLATYSLEWIKKYKMRYG